jgi:uncharacterized protein YndB with AHSA1/START domain
MAIPKALPFGPPKKQLAVWNFAEERGDTKQILRARVIKKTAQAAPYLAGMEQGWIQTLERLSAYLVKA